MSPNLRAFPGLGRRSPLVLTSALLLTVLCAALPAKADRNRPALPARFLRSPFSLMSLSVGTPNDGFHVRAKKLRPSPFLKVKTSSRRNVYGHPSLVLMLQRSAREVAAAGNGATMLVGDLSSERGGPLWGHVSHQSGRDADIGFYALDERGRSVLVDHFITFLGDGTSPEAKNLRFDDYRNWLLVQSWVKDKRAGLSHIFVSRPLRARLLTFAAKNPAFKPYVPEAAVLLKQPEDAAAHDDHFHVRVACPENQSEICRR